MSNELPLALRCLAEELCIPDTAPWNRLREAADEIERLRRERDDYCRQLTRGIPVVRDLTMERDRLRAALQEIEWYPARATFTSDPKTWMDMRDLASRALRPGDFTEKNDG